MDLTAVRDGLVDAVSGIAGLTVSASIPKSVFEPHFYVGPISVDFDRAMGRGMDELTVDCRLLVSLADDITGATTLDAFMAGSGSQSIKAALEAARGAPGSPALAGACDDFHVMRIEGYGIYQHGATDYLGARFIVRVIGDGA